MSLTVEVLNLGDIPADWSFTVFGRPPGTGVVGPANAFLILGGEQPLLVDSGTLPGGVWCKARACAAT